MDRWIAMNMNKKILVAALCAGSVFAASAAEVTADDALAAVAGWVNVKA